MDKWGYSEADVHTFWRKNVGFFEIYGTQTRGEEGSREGVSEDILRTRGSDQFFAILCAHLLGQPLILFFIVM